MSRRPPGYRPALAGALAAALALVVAFAAPAPAARAAVPGVSVDLTWSIPRRDMDREIGLLKRAGVRWVRMTMAWSGVEPHGSGGYDERYLSDMDYAVGQARAAGLNVLMPITDGVPYWASADPKRHVEGGEPRWNHYWRPRDWGDYGRFARFVAARYGPLGVHAYEVWNEPNLDRFWPSGPNAGEYAAMLRAAYPEIKAADPHATVLLGGLYQNGDSFLAGVYAAGARPFFDAVGDHFYTEKDPARCSREGKGPRWSPDSLCGIANVEKVMADHGDATKPVWITEFGWSTFDDGVSADEQARYLTSALAKLGRDFPAVRVAFAYNLRDNYWMHDDPSNREADYGLLRTDFSPKPGFAELERAASGQTGVDNLQDAVAALAEAVRATG